MDELWVKDYPAEPDLDDNSSLKRMLALIGTGRRVVDFGCATGYFAQLLRKDGCTVVGVEINPGAAKISEQHCESVVVADLDFVHLNEILPETNFDVAVFGDVLEHLRDPWRVLEEVHQILKPDGFVVASIPNIAHGAIRLALLQGNFEYTKVGILDDTHLRFFTRKTVEELFEQSGFAVESINRTTYPMFFDRASVPHPLVPYIERDSLPSELVQQIEQEQEASTLQFVVRAFPQSLEGKYAALAEKYAALAEKHAKAVVQNAQLEAQLQSTQIELERSRLHEQPQLEQTQSQLEQTQSQLEQTQSQLQKIELELGQTHTLVVTMESSKFWKLRQVWMRFKRLVFKG